MSRVAVSPGRAPRRAGRAARLLGRLREDDGSTLPLVIGFGALGLVVALLVAAASSLYLERKQLLILADGAALVGAEAFELDDVTVGPGGRLRVELDPADVRRDVRAYLAGNPLGDFDGLVLERATSLDGRSATVTVSAAWRPPVLTLFVPDGLRIDAEATARAVFG